MGRVKTIERIVDNSGHNPHVDRLFSLTHHLEQYAERCSVNEVHDQQQLALIHHNVVDGNDVGAVDAGGQPRFIREHGDKRRILDELRMEAFDGDGSRKPSHTLEPPQKHRGHSAMRKLRTQFIATDGHGQ